MRTSIHPSLHRSFFGLVRRLVQSLQTSHTSSQPHPTCLHRIIKQGAWLGGYAYLLGMYVIDPPANIVLQDRESASIFYQRKKSAGRGGRRCQGSLQPLSSRDDVVVIRTWRHTRTRSPELCLGKHCHRSRMREQRLCRLLFTSGNKCCLRIATTK